MMGINEFAKIVHENSVRHGWWEEERSFPEIAALIHAEISEALEEYRDGHAPGEIYFGEAGKPEGIAVELADAIIRILDYCAREGIDIEGVMLRKHEFNVDRPYRHGGKRC